MNPRESIRRAALAALFATALGACIDEKIVFRDRELFNPPADSLNGFLGYFDRDTKQTSCGNCHVGHQRDWVNTAHADAWEGLQTSGAAQASCEGCHTVNERGNILAVAGGWNAVKDSAYHDVQCESCHGPGLTHLENPEATQPLASIMADTGISNGCGECHAGTHHPFVEQWRESRHGGGTALATAGPRAECAPCHEGRTAMQVKFGVTANYVEKNGTTLQPISCAVCHNPHGSPYDGQLRASASEPSLDNLCVACHSRQGVPSGATQRGPHAAQGLLVIGTNVGWIPPHFTYDTSTTISSHGTTANPRLCASCHVSQFTVTDPNSGNFQFQSVGHSFEATPCVDADGLPMAGPCPTSERNFSGCTQGACHLGPGNESQVRTLYDFFVSQRINTKLDQLWTDTDADNVLETSDGGLLPQLVPVDTVQLDVRSTKFTVAKGVIWNAQLAYTSDRTQWASGRTYVGTAGTGKLGITFSAHKSSGNGVHNPFFLEALLNASISALMNEYGLAPPAGLDLETRATPPPGLRRVTQ